MIPKWLNLSSHIEKMAENSGMNLSDIGDWRRRVKVWVHSHRLGEEGILEFNGNFRELVDDLQSLLLSIPPEYRGGAVVWLDGKDLEIFYHREETDNELVFRVVDQYATNLPPQDGEPDARCDGPINQIGA